MRSLPGGTFTGIVAAVLIPLVSAVGAIIAAIVLSAPWILWQIWKFVEPGLYRHERRVARLLVPGSFGRLK
jgi:sec-independent protein translocase protein TatC